MKKIRRKIIKYLLFLFVLVVISLVFNEIFLRVFYPQPLYNECYSEYHPNADGPDRVYDSQLGWFTAKNYFNCVYQAGTNKKIYKIHNSRGLRLEREVDYEKNNKTRIILLGDSMTYGHGVDQNDTLAYILQSKLTDNYEVLPFGISGYGNDQEFILLKTEILKYHPDIVVLSYFQNDIAENLINTGFMTKPRIIFIKNETGRGYYYYENYPAQYKKTIEPGTPFKGEPIRKTLLKNFHVYSLLYHNSQKIKEKLSYQKKNYFERHYWHDTNLTKARIQTNYYDGMFAFEKRDNELYKQGMTKIHNIFSLFKFTAGENEFDLLVVFVPSTYQISSSAQKEEASRWVDVNETFFDFNKMRIQIKEQIINNLDLEYLDLYAPFNEREELFLKDDVGHLSEEGSKAMVDEIYKKLIELDWIKN